MCESAVYIKKQANSEEIELVMEDIAIIKPIEKGKYFLRSILGESMEIKGKLQEINLMTNKIIFDPFQD